MDAQNIASYLPAMARERPDAAAIVAVTGRGADGKLRFRALTCRELDEESDRLARGLHAAGVTPGTRTVLMARPGPEFFALVFALFKSGAVMVGVDPGLGRRHLSCCLAEAEPGAFIGIPLAHLGRILWGWGRGTVRTNILAGAGPGWGGLISLPALRRLGDAAAGAPLPRNRAEDTAAILFTSGSTGAPKGVVYTHGNFIAQLEALRELYGLAPGEVDVSTFPLFALFGPALGMTSVIPRMDFTRPGKVAARNITDAVKQFGATNLFGSPALLDRVARGSQRGDRLPSLKRVLSAGAPVAADILERFAKLLPEGSQIYTPYGATEALPVSSIGSREVLAETRVATARGGGVCVGRPVPGLDVRVIGITDGPIGEWRDDRVLRDGAIGELVVSGAQVTGAYFNRERATALAKIPIPGGGFWHRMGDTGRFDAQGRLWFCGRMSQRVVTADRTLFTICCEGVFNVHPDVRRTALVGVARAEGIRPVLCVELEPASAGANRHRIRDELLERGRSFEHTAVIQDILFHPRFPVDIRHNAKIRREQLAAWAAGQLK